MASVIPEPSAILRDSFAAEMSGTLIASVTLLSSPVFRTPAPSVKSSPAIASAAFPVIASVAAVKSTLAAASATFPSMASVIAE